MNGISETSAWPPFLFHYIIVFLCAALITCVCILKFKYLYWYSQPITFRFTLRRWLRGDGTGNTVMNPLSIAERCNSAVVYPFLHFVHHGPVRVFCSRHDLLPLSDAPYERIAEFLSRQSTEIVNETVSDPGVTLYIPGDILELILSEDTYGLSVFIGILQGDNTVIKGDNTPTIKGVCILTPRIMLSFGPSSASTTPRSVSIYVCDHLAWAKYITSERESLALLETTEYIQKSRENAGEQTLYRYREIPWFVIPFTTVYSYTFASSANMPIIPSLGASLSVIPVSATNFANFYAFVNECARDFRCCILHEITRLQYLIKIGVYRIYMLLLNKVRVIAVYIFAPSWMKVGQAEAAAAAAAAAAKRYNITKPKKTLGNRISALHNHISQTSTALVKYLPPVVPPKYDALGKRIKRSGASASIGGGGGGRRDGNDTILRIISSIQHKSLCDRDTFVRGFYIAVEQLRNAATVAVICIDTLAHNYRIIDSIVATAQLNLLSRDKWYYILYNAIIHQETLCKDILVV